MRIALLLCFCVGALVPSADADERIIHFDLPPISVAHPINEGQPATEFPPANADLDDSSLVRIELKLSSMITIPDAPQIDQWIVRCQPRNASLSIADYAPKTEFSSDIQGTIEVKTTSENTNSIGMSLDGNYGHIARFKSGVDRATKNTGSIQLDRVAPVQVVTASGTICRGRGVYFKLRWTAQQVLEGEKTFYLTLRVPPNWRGGLIDVSVVAQSNQNTLTPWDRETRTLGSADFVVATHRQGDRRAAKQARELFDAEDNLRHAAQEYCRRSSLASLTFLLRHVGFKQHHRSNRPTSTWIDRLLLSSADPYLDTEIRQLPMPVRVAVLDYVDLRDDFAAINEPAR